MGDKLVPKIVLIGKIKVEGSLCHAGLIDDVGDRSFVKTILHEEPECSIQKRIFFLLLVLIYFSHEKFLRFGAPAPFCDYYIILLRKKY